MKGAGFFEKNTKKKSVGSFHFQIKDGIKTARIEAAKAYPVVCWGAEDEPTKSTL